MNLEKKLIAYVFGNKKTLPYEAPEISEEHSFEEKLLLHSLQKSLDTFLSDLKLSDLNPKQVYYLFHFLPLMGEGPREKIIETFFDEWNFYQLATHTTLCPLTKVQELLHFHQKYLSVFVFLRKNRQLPGRLIIRKANGEFYQDDKQQVWSIPVLGLASRGLPAQFPYGDTPCGVFRIDSVMPEANHPLDFGEFRRLIIHFIHPSENEEKIQEHLPASHFKEDWWLPSVLCRDLGRNLLRIHGTKRVNKNPLSLYFPFYPTSGCLATRETEGPEGRSDQRLLLDALMTAQGLECVYESERKISALLYILELEGEGSPIELSDIPFDSRL